MLSKTNKKEGKQKAQATKNGPFPVPDSNTALVESRLLTSPDTVSSQ